MFQECKADYAKILKGNDTALTTTTTPSPPDGGSDSHFDTQGIVGLVIWFMCVLYSSIRNSSNSTASKLSGADKILLKDNGATGGSSSTDAESAKVRELREVRLCDFVIKNNTFMYPLGLGQ